MPRARTELSALLLLSGVVAGCGGGGGNMNASPPPSGTPTPAPAQHTDVVTYKNHRARTGQNLTESVLTLASVNATSFGLLRTLAADGKVDAQPLYLSALTVQGAPHNVVFAATGSDSVYAYDSDTGTLLGRVSLLASGETNTRNAPRCCC